MPLSYPKKGESTRKIGSFSGKRSRGKRKGRRSPLYIWAKEKEIQQSCKKKDRRKETRESCSILAKASRQHGPVGKDDIGGG